jgi:hypothetical protein
MQNMNQLFLFRRFITKPPRYRHSLALCLIYERKAMMKTSKRSMAILAILLITLLGACQSALDTRTTPTSQTNAVQIDRKL